ncbi:MAG: hypothetical protein AAF633_14090 [Chloroflexota bacterium]
MHSRLTITCLSFLSLLFLYLWLPTLTPTIGATEQKLEPLQDQNGVIRGQIADLDTGVPVAYEGYVQAIDIDRSKIASSVKVDPSSSYSLTLQPGNYHLKYFRSSSTEPTHDGVYYYGGNYHPDSATTISLTAGAEIVANFNLTRTGIIVGRITAADSGLPLAGGVVAFDGDDKPDFYIGNDSVIVGAGKIEANGQYTIYAPQGSLSFLSIQAIRCRRESTVLNITTINTRLNRRSPFL